MEWRSKFKRLMFSGAVIFSGYGALKLIPGSRHDLRASLWYLTVGLACALGSVASWLGRKAAGETVEEERNNSLSRGSQQ
ncbi:MAG: hypothetical protein WBF09_20605 [Candidatus Acidiferrum sp.]